ncbi:hypothetical protein ACFLVE_04630 [Chloroflexota bacterium]
MAQKTQSKGQCTYCREEFTKGGMIKHLSSCPQRLEAITVAEQLPQATENLYHLRIQDAGHGDYWLDLEVRGSATLQQMDKYLRVIWLECCGHLSRFSIGSAWGGREIAKNRHIEQIFDMGVELTHIYDFGTPSETAIRFISVREGKPMTRHPIALMARNSAPEAACMDCGQPAAWLCIECLYENERSGLLCDQHAKTHPHDNYGEPIPLVNSPRLGMCGYTGPAEPPY